MCGGVCSRHHHHHHHTTSDKINSESETVPSVFWERVTRHLYRVGSPRCLALGRRHVFTSPDRPGAVFGSITSFPVIKPGSRIPPTTESSFLFSVSSSIHPSIHGIHSLAFFYFHSFAGVCLFLVTRKGRLFLLSGSSFFLLPDLSVMERPLLGGESSHGIGPRDRFNRRSDAITYGSPYQKAAALVDLVCFLCSCNHLASSSSSSFQLLFSSRTDFVISGSYSSCSTGILIAFNIHYGIPFLFFFFNSSSKAFFILINKDHGTFWHRYCYTFSKFQNKIKRKIPLYFCTVIQVKMDGLTAHSLLLIAG